MEFNFTGKKVLVTGAGRGIGRATAIALAKSDCKVYALSRTKETLDTLVEEYPDIVPITQDLMNWEETKTTLEQVDVLDGLVNNAALTDVSPTPAIDVPQEQLELYMRNNLFSAVNCTQVVAKKMVASGKPGSIVNISSILGPLALPLALSYGLSKAGMDFTTKQFALELGPHNIRVNSVNPTKVVATDEEASDENNPAAHFIRMCSERSPMGRVVHVPEVVSPILYLLSDAAAMVTGTLHFIDGGSSCNITTKQ